MFTDEQAEEVSERNRLTRLHLGPQPCTVGLIKAVIRNYLTLKSFTLHVRACVRVCVRARLVRF